jgi:hypothetical protein
MPIKYGLQLFFFELTDNDGQTFLSAIVPGEMSFIVSTINPIKKLVKIKKL